MLRLRLHTLLAACVLLAGALGAPRSAMSQPPVFLGSWPSTGIPLGLAIHPDGTMFVSDEHNGVVLRSFTQTGVPIATFPILIPTQPIESYGIGFLSDQSIVVPDYYGRRVLRYSPTGTLLSQFATGGSTSSWIAVDPSDNLYVSDDNGDKVRRFTSQGALLAEWYVNHPAGLAYVDGLVYVTEMFTGKINVYSPTGVQQGSFNTGVAWAQQLFYNGAGKLYVGDHGNHQVKCFATDGTLEWTLGTVIPGYPFPSAGLFSVTQAPDGTLFMGDYANRNVLAFSVLPVSASRFSFGALKTRYRGPVTVPED